MKRQLDFTWLFTVAIVVLCLAISVPPTLAKGKPALSGYDLVSYFKKNIAEEGQSRYSYLYKNKEYWFSSEKHRELFKKSPKQYLPQFDGYCAYGVTFGKKLAASPKAWKIVNGKLYFNLNQEFLKKWSVDVHESIRAGEEQWIMILDQKKKKTSDAGLLKRHIATAI